MFYLIGLLVMGVLGLILGLTSCASYSERVMQEMRDEQMTRFTREEAVRVLLSEAPRELGEIQKWLNSNPDFHHLLTDKFKCRRHGLAQEIYNYPSE